LTALEQIFEINHEAEIPIRGVFDLQMIELHDEIEVAPHPIEIASSCRANQIKPAHVVAPAEFK